MDIVMVCLGKRDSENYKSCLKLIDVITASDLSAQERLDIMENEFSIKITKNIEEGVTTMCNVSYGIAQRERNEGIIEALVTAVKALMRTGQYNFDSAFNMIDAPKDKYNQVKELVLG